MRLLDWWKRRSRDSRNPRLHEWRERWAAAAAQPSAEQLGTLTSDLEELGLDEDEIEIEREMLEALARLVALAASVAEQGLPALETGHRIAGSDTCHFTAPASMPDEAAQPSGRLLLTSTRAAFAAGGASRTIAWHTVTEAVPQDRDLLLIRTDRQTGHRFRCNSYSDAVCAAFIARRLIAVRSARAPRV